MGTWPLRSPWPDPGGFYRRIDLLATTLLTASVGQLIPPQGKKGDTVTLMTPGADLRPYKNSLRLLVGEAPAEITQVDSGSVRFKVPAKPGANEAILAGGRGSF